MGERQRSNYLDVTSFQGSEDVLKQHRGENVWKVGKEGAESFQGCLQGKERRAFETEEIGEPRDVRETGLPGACLGWRVGGRWGAGRGG